MGSASSVSGKGNNNSTDGGLLRFGSGQSQGRKRQQEDTSWGRILKTPTKVDEARRSTNIRGFFVVCDGHGGVDAAEFVSHNLLKYFLLEKDLDMDYGRAMFNAFLRADAEFSLQVESGKRQDSGTTALALLVFGSRVVIANVGDCRALLSRNGSAKELTTDHRPNDPSEKKRIEEAGGFVDCDGYMCGELGVSRAIGNVHFTALKKKGDSLGPLIADPDIVEHEIEQYDEFVVAVSDGVTDALTNQSIINLARDSLRECNNPDLASKAVVEAAYQTGVRDNLTALTICFKPTPPIKKRLIKKHASHVKLDQKSESFLNLVKALQK